MRIVSRLQSRGGGVRRVRTWSSIRGRARVNSSRIQHGRRIPIHLGLWVFCVLGIGRVVVVVGDARQSQCLPGELFMLCRRIVA